jgi:hypothetical protein
MARLTKQDVEERFAQNISRVRSLMTAYTALVGPGGGRATVEQADILRAATILLHAALEDLLRSVEELRLPTASKEAFDGFKLVPASGVAKDAKERFTLVELAEYRGQSIDEVIGKSIDLHLEKSNYNNIGEVKSVLKRTAIDSSFLTQPAAASLEAMMKRRHLIAHRADRNPMSGRGHHAAKSIGIQLVESWTAVVDAFGKSVLTKL